MCSIIFRIISPRKNESPCGCSLQDCVFYIDKTKCCSRWVIRHLVYPSFEQDFIGMTISTSTSSTSVHWKIKTMLFLLNYQSVKCTQLVKPLHSSLCKTKTFESLLTTVLLLICRIIINCEFSSSVYNIRPIILFLLIHSLCQLPKRM